MEEILSRPKNRDQLRTEQEDESDDATSDLASTEDLLAEFDVDSDDREFLAEMLRVAPKDEVKELQKAREEQPDYDNSIKDFAEVHPIYGLQAGEVDEDALMEFQSHVYEFSRAAGVARRKAEANVRRAVAAWIKYATMGNRSFVQSEFKVKEGAPKRADVKNYYKVNDISNNAKTEKKKEWRKKKKKKKKKKRELRRDEERNESSQLIAQHEDDNAKAPVFVDTTKVQATPVPIPIAGQKRKRASLESAVAQGGDVEPVQDKRHRRELSGMEVDATTSATIDRHATKMSKTQNNPLASDMVALSIQEPPIKSVKQKKMRPKPGPTTSAYFAKSQAPPVELASSEVAGNLLGGLPDVNATGLSRRDKKRMKRAAEMAARAENLRLEVDLPQGPLAHSADIAAKATLDMEIDKEPMPHQPKLARRITEENAVETAIYGGRPANEPPNETTNSHKKHKRKRKRNQNRLHDDEAESVIIGIREHRERHGPQLFTEQNQKEVPSYPDEGSQPSARGVRSLNSPIENDRIPAKRQQLPEQQDSPSGEHANPLTELDNVNASGQKRERRDRGRRRNRSSLVEPNTELNGQQAKDCHS
jgi:hypothetical protein